VNYAVTDTRGSDEEDGGGAGGGGSSKRSRRKLRQDTGPNTMVRQPIITMLMMIMI
jgi:hypothetical protein